jgi:hypothetical protein
MKSLQYLISIGLISAVLFWRAQGQVSDDGAAANPNTLSTPKANPPAVPPQNSSAASSPITPSISSTQLVDFLRSIPLAVVMVLLLSTYWQKFGITQRAVKDEVPSRVLASLIREVEESVGYARNEARAKAKAWLEGNVTSLGKNEIFLAKAHFSYLLPSDWGAKA